MRVAFISDLHLTPERPDIARAFACYLEKSVHDIDALYILGDLFEYWVGDDAMEPFHQQVAAQLNAFSDTGKPLFFMPGNRDFSIGRSFLKQAGATLLKDPCTINLNGETVLLMHGDLLCTGDVQYLKYRRIIRNPLVMAFLRMTPLSYRKKLGRKIRSNSLAAKTEKQSSIMDVTPSQVINIMERYKVRTLIHGHTHRPAIHDVVLSYDSGQRYVLGDWDRKGWVLTTSGAKLELKYFEIT